VVVSTTAFAIVIVVLLTVIATQFVKTTDHLGHIRRMLGQILDERMEPEAFSDRLHRASLGATESAKILKSIEDRIEPITTTSAERLIIQIAERISGGERRSAERKADE
jgi:hypothetical protein